MKATSGRGNQLTDRFSLTGFAQAVERARQECCLSGVLLARHPGTSGSRRDRPIWRFVPDRPKVSDPHGDGARYHQAQFEHDPVRRHRYRAHPTSRNWPSSSCRPVCPAGCPSSGSRGRSWRSASPGSACPRRVADARGAALALDLFARCAVVRQDVECRQGLAPKPHGHLTLDRPQVVSEQVSKDGTRKWLLRCPRPDRSTKAPRSSAFTSRRSTGAPCACRARSAARSPARSVIRARSAWCAT